jgi:C2H2 type zinc finger protein
VWGTPFIDARVARLGGGGKRTSKRTSKRTGESAGRLGIIDAAAYFISFQPGQSPTAKMSFERVNFCAHSETFRLFEDIDAALTEAKSLTKTESEPEPIDVDIVFDMESASSSQEGPGFETSESTAKITDPAPTKVPNTPRRKRPSSCYVCEYCDHPFSRKWNYKSHLKTHFPRRRDHRCATCGKEFYRGSDLTRHMSRCGDHTVNVQYVCSGPCGKSFARKDTMLKHQRLCL